MTNIAPNSIYHSRIHIDSDVLNKMNEWLDKVYSQIDFDSKAKYVISLTFEELILNTKKYGATNSKIVTSTLTLEVYQTYVILRYEDNAPPFDITNVSPRDLNRPLNEINPGGLGIHLIRELSRDFKYNTTKDGNSVDITFNTIDR